MPNWKKVIVSGSNAILNNITASGDISASGDIYATNFIGTIDSASYTETIEITPIAAASNFPIVFTLNDSQLYTDLPESDFYYRPSTNTLTVENIVGTASLSSLSSKVALNDFISGGTLDLIVGNTSNTLFTVPDNNLIYNFNTDTLIVPNLEGTASIAITASYAENALNISNNTNNRILTATGNNTINAEQNLTFNGSYLSIAGGILQTYGGSRVLISDVTNGSYPFFQVGDIQLNRRNTIFEVKDESGSFYFHTENNNPHYLNSESLFISGNISSSGLYIDNYKKSTAVFTGLVEATQVSASILKTDLLQGGWLSNNGNNRIITSDGDGTFTAESGLTFDGSELSLNGNLTVSGDITAEQYIVNSTVTNVTMSFSSGSTIFGDSLDDTHLFTGSVDITGSLTLDGISYPTADGENGDVITTDGLGNLSIDKPKIYMQVKNAWSTTLLKGTPVYASSSTGNLENVKPASASNADTMPAIGVLASDLNPEGEGLVIVTGFINGVDTSTFNESDVVYVGADGGFTNVKPTGSNLIQNLGIVTKVDSSNGSGFVYGSGRANDVPNISPGYAWVGNSDSVATAVPTSSFAGEGDNLGNHTASLNLNMDGNSIYSASNYQVLNNGGYQLINEYGSVLNGVTLDNYNTIEVGGFNNSSVKIGRHYDTPIGTFSPSGLFLSGSITASGDISSSGNISADHLILNPNTTTTSSVSNEAEVDISLGDEEYKRGVIKRVFDWRENVPSSDNVNINSHVIAHTGEFKRGEFRVNIEVKGFHHPETESLFLNSTASFSEEFSIIDTYLNPVDNVPLEISYFPSNDTPTLSAVTSIISTFLLAGSSATEPSVACLRVDVGGDLIFNMLNTTTANQFFSGSLTTVYLDYQLYK